MRVKFKTNKTIAICISLNLLNLPRYYENYYLCEIDGDPKWGERGFQKIQIIIMFYIRARAVFKST